MQQINHADAISGAGDPSGKADGSGPRNTRGEKARAMLRARLGEDVFSSWFHSMEFEAFDGQVVLASVPVKFLKKWIQSHYADDLLECCAAEFTGVERVDLALREPGMAEGRQAA